MNTQPQFLAPVWVEVGDELEQHHELPQNIDENLWMRVVITRSTIQVAGASGEGYKYMQGMKVRCEATWPKR